MNNQRVLGKRPPLQSGSLEQGSHPGGSAHSIVTRSNQRRSSTASNQLTVLHPTGDPDSLVTIQWRNSGLPSPPSKPDAFSSSSAHQLLGRHFTSNPCRQPGTVERCLQHTVGQRNQPSFSWDRQRNQPSFCWDRQRNQPFLGTKNGVLCSGRGRFWICLAPIA